MSFYVKKNMWNLKVVGDDNSPTMPLLSNARCSNTTFLKFSWNQCGSKDDICIQLLKQIRNCVCDIL